MVALVNNLPDFSVDNGGTPSRFGVVHLYSPAALTDAAGAVVERMTYDAYGKQTVTTAAGTALVKSAVGFDRGFTGYVSDAEIDAYHARTREYSPILGRFLNRNPWERTVSATIWPIHQATVIGTWHQFMERALAESTAPSYIQNRYSLYDYANGDPINSIEPFSGAECTSVTLKKISVLVGEEVAEVGKVPPGVTEIIRTMDPNLTLTRLLVGQTR